MVESFDIEDGQLDGLTPQQCFVRGCEWGTFKTACDDSYAFRRTVHRERVERLCKVAARRGRTFRIEHLDDQWTEIVVDLDDDLRKLAN
jgi:hypothetical protein